MICSEQGEYVILLTMNKDANEQLVVSETRV